MGHWPITRILLISAVGAGMAAGGYFVAQAQAQAPSSSHAVPAPDFSKVAPSLLLVAALQNADTLELSDHQVARLREVEASVLPRYRDVREQVWRARLDLAMKEEAGDVVLPDPRNMVGVGRRRLELVEALQQPVNALVSETEAQVAKILNARQLENARGYALFAEQEPTYRKTLELLNDPNVQDELGLSARQRKQMQTVRREFEQDRLLGPHLLPPGTKVPSQGSVPRMAEPGLQRVDQGRGVILIDPKVDVERLSRVTEYHAALVWSLEARRLLSPLQRLHLDTLLNDQIYVVR